MISNKTVMIAYRCPECGREITTETNFFKLSGNELKLPCDGCKSSKLTASLSKDSKVRLLVPCLACPHPHPYTISSSVFFTKDLFVLPCSFCGMDICFIGNKNTVEEALEKSNEELLQMMDYKEDEDSPIFEDETMMSEVLSVIEDLASENKIFCLCEKQDNHPQISVVIDYDKISLTCKECNAKAVLYAASEEDIIYAFELDKLVLK